MRCKPEKSAQASAAFQEDIAASRPLDGVVSFDIGADLSEPDTFISVEVFEDRDALDRQESLPVTQRTIGFLEEFLAAEPEATIYDVASSQPWGE
jgi:quinol monooxygenase YgiN